MTRNFSTLLTFVGLIGLSTTLSAQEKFTIQPRFEPGKYVQTMVVDNDAVMRIGELDTEDGIPTKQEQTQRFNLVVSPPDEKGTQKVEFTFAEIKLTQNTMGMEMTYDSTDKDNQNPALAPMFNAMLGSKLTFDMTKDGKTENVKGFDDLWEKMIKNMPGDSGQMLEPMKEKMSDEVFSGMLGGVENKMGKEPRAVGEQWTETQSQNLPFLSMSETEMTHTLKSVKDDVAVIATTGKIKMQGDTIEMGPVKMNFEKGDMSITSSTSIDIKTGLAFETKGETEMDITAEMGNPVNEDAPKMKMRITTKAVTTMTIAKVE